MLNHILAVMLLLPLLAAGDGPTPIPAQGFPGKGSAPAYLGETWFSNNWNMRRNAFWKDRTADRGKVVLVGDSITQLWKDMAGAFPFPVANRGISADFTRGLLFRLDEDVLDLDPAAIVLLIGTNDLGGGGSAPPEEVAGNIGLILDHIQAWAKKRPGAKRQPLPVVVCHLMPRGRASENFKPRIEKVNQLIDALVKGRPRTAVCDTWGVYATAEGLPDLADFPDALHPAQPAYVKWRDALVKTLATLKFPEKP